MDTMQRPNITLGDWLAKARKQAGFTQQRAARAIGVSRPLISMWERNERFPDVREFAAMMRVYDADWLAGTLTDWSLQGYARAA